MKPATEYKTLKSLEADLKKEKIRLNHRYNYSLERMAENKPDTPYDAYRINDGELSFDREQSQFSCAINEIGSFCHNDNLSKYWPYLFRGYQLNSRKKEDFVRCSVSERQEGCDEIIDALIEVGFIPTGRVRSNHGRYYIYMLEWQK